MTSAPIPLEHAEQVAVMQWWALWSKANGYDPRLLFAIPNGAYKSMRAATKFRAEGLRPGVPDLFLAFPRPCFSGMFVELKRRNGKVVADSDQAQMIDLLRRQDYNVVVAKGADEAIRAIREYLR